jgi:hypothetical protein
MNHVVLRSTDFCGWMNHVVVRSAGNSGTVRSNLNKSVKSRKPKVYHTILPAFIFQSENGYL